MNLSYFGVSLGAFLALQGSGAAFFSLSWWAVFGGLLIVGIFAKDIAKEAQS